MNKNTFYFFLAIIAVAYGQSAKTLPNVDAAAVQETVVQAAATKTIPANLPVDTSVQDTSANSASSSGSTSSGAKAPPSEFFGSEYSKVVDTTTTPLPPATKTVPPEILTSISAAQAATAAPGDANAAGAAAGAAGTTADAAADDLNDSSATKIAGTFLAAIVALVMSLF